MSEQMFDEYRSEWDRLAAEVARLDDPGQAAAEPPSPAYHAALDALRDAITPAVGPRIADWAVTAWLIMGDPIAERVAAEVAEDRPYTHGGPR